MPAAIYIDTKKGMVYSKMSGLYSFADALNHRDRIADHPDFDPDFNQFADYRGIVAPSLGRKNIAILAERDVFGRHSRRSFVTSTAWQFGYCRMFATYRELKGESGIRVYKTMKPALTWVGLAEEPDPSWFGVGNEQGVAKGPVRRRERDLEMEI